MSGSLCKNWQSLNINNSKSSMNVETIFKKQSERKSRVDLLKIELITVLTEQNCKLLRAIDEEEAHGTKLAEDLIDARLQLYVSNINSKQDCSQDSRDDEITRLHIQNLIQTEECSPQINREKNLLAEKSIQTVDSEGDQCIDNLSHTTKLAENERQLSVMMNKFSEQETHYRAMADRVMKLQIRADVKNSFNDSSDNLDLQAEQLAILSELQVIELTKKVQKLRTEMFIDKATYERAVARSSADLHLKDEQIRTVEGLLGELEARAQAAEANCVRAEEALREKEEQINFLRTQQQTIRNIEQTKALASPAKKTATDNQQSALLLSPLDDGTVSTLLSASPPKTPAAPITTIPTTVNRNTIHGRATAPRHIIVTPSTPTTTVHAFRKNLEVTPNLTMTPTVASTIAAPTAAFTPKATSGPSVTPATPAFATSTTPYTTRQRLTLGSPQDPFTTSESSEFIEKVTQLVQRLRSGEASSASVQAEFATLLGTQQLGASAEVLDLSDVDVTDTQVCALSVLLSRDAQVKEVYLGDRFTSEVGVRALAELLARRPDLRKVALCGSRTTYINKSMR